MAETATGTAPAETNHEPPDRPETLDLLIPSPIGDLGISFRETTIVGLVIAPDRKQRKSYISLKEALKERDRADFLDEALGRFSEFFAGARRRLELEHELPTEGLDDFARRVLIETARIPYGETRTYQKIAAQMGASDAYRLIRSVLVTNPLPILVPCHRVVPRKAGPGSYVAGVKRKGWLLSLEQRVSSEAS